ncbi:hypothetical protein [uncultured Jatrophihabitans sp.]|uniref:hypothetical protein n=1 Tax=uncultured Jatrophihabitans sp. TaxID=1610747 RepID=UPI0035CA12BE
MLTPMQVTPETMSSQGAQLTTTGEAMASGLQSLAATVDGDGYPWGGDEQGTLFAGLYQTVLSKAFDAISSHVEQVQYAGAALGAQAESYRGVEAGLTQGFTSAAGEIAG